MAEITHFGKYSPNGGTDDFTALRGLVDQLRESNVLGASIAQTSLVESLVAAAR